MSKGYVYDNTTGRLMVFINSKDPNIKGARAKAQKFLKSKGVYDAFCWFYDTLQEDSGTWVIFEVTSALIALKLLTKGVKL